MEQYKDTTTKATTTFSYNIPTTPSQNNPFWTEAVQTGDGGLSVKVRKFYTGLGQLIQTQSVGVTLDSGANRTVVVDTKFDAAGRVWKQSAPYDIATPTGYYPPNWGQGYSTSAYDVLGRPELATATDGVTTAYSYTITTTNCQ